MTEKLRRLSFRNILLLFILGPLLVAGLCQLAKAGQYLFFRGDSTFPESAVVQTALWSKASGRIYPALDQSPYTPAPYGPLFYASLTAVAKLADADLDHLLVYGRIVVFSAFLLLLFGAYSWERRQKLAVAIACFSPALILSQIDFEAWNASVRPDLPALLVSFAAFFVLTTAPISWRRVALAGCLCGIAGLLKQSFIALPLSVLFWLLTTRQKRAALVFLASIAAVGIAVLVPLALRHEPFAREMLLARYSPVSFPGALRLLKTDFLNYPGQIVLVGLGVLGLQRMDPKVVSARRLISTYFLLAWITNFYTAMAPGASVNAFLESWLITSICAPFALLDLAETWEQAGVTVRRALLLLWISIMVVDLNSWRMLVSQRPPSEFGKVALLMHGHRVLSDIPYIATHGDQPELLDPSVNHYLEIAGQWSAQPVLQELRSGRFDYVVMGLNGGRPRQWRGLTLFSTSILAQVQADYQPMCVTDRFAVFVPRLREIVGKAADFQKAGCRAPFPADAGIELLQDTQQR